MFTIEIKDSDNVVHKQTCDNYTYNVDTAMVQCYELVDKDVNKQKLVASYTNVVYFRKIETKDHKE